MNYKRLLFNSILNSENILRRYHLPRNARNRFQEIRSF
ncbi:hypothetical protein T11_1623 [Trichinella zimbabwensis]|uniref:Uncharacterized protein n=1 Tax=Trichinella zimbabwensis TaxID=268475 RepID=A0A0V1GDT8_9BILA|nr:hypothetical protein T11_1623 [Trichinella zimbabwensis]